MDKSDPMVRRATDTHIVFVAPTKPLVSQQVKACFEIVGIPRSETTLLTGNIPPGLRAEEWWKKLVFMTPQTINELKTCIRDGGVICRRRSTSYDW